jgi:threonyl-tRNA synthetase
MKHPPYVGASPERTTGEWMTRAGASLLAERIRDAWRRVGIDVQPVIEEGFPDDARRKEQVYVARLPSLVNGLPRT